MMTLRLHWLASLTALLLCCTSWSHGTFRISPWQQDPLSSHEKGAQEVLLNNNNLKINSSFCKSNVGLTKEAQQIQRIFCKATGLYPNEEDTQITFSDSSDSEPLIQEALSTIDLNSFFHKENIPEKIIHEKSPGTAAASTADEVIETGVASTAEEAKAKRQFGTRAGPCRSMPQTYGEHEPLPWTCRQRKEWLSLPDNVYPNRVYSTVCESVSCMNGHFNCTPVTYSLQLLKMCYGNQCNDDRIPYSLRSSWLFHEYTVTIGCSCTR